ncbi:hypothetical protein Ddye_019966 [Dipteronia dyeriana]|uniref:Uncharacterized protein n=1 Tax=Dipteronia dyeriana TaxID=168575 RepID=A0AAD9TYX2_9ROSI|nr:hypothetical protein Ddye_019966 [Dipteronia dyeriana]
MKGIGLVIFNSRVHEIRNQSLTSWMRVFLVPACGGLVVSILNGLELLLIILTSFNSLKAVLQPLSKAAVACITLCTHSNSLRPEGPSVEIGNP